MGEGKIYYWLKDFNLGIGSIINPGNWGNFNKNTPIRNMDSVILFREYIFEQVRLSFYPEMVSRFNCVFLFDNYDSAIDYLRIYKFPFLYLYSVEIVNESHRLSEGDFTFYGASVNCSISQMESMAHLYWKSKNIVNREILTDSPVRILGNFGFISQGYS